MKAASAIVFVSLLCFTPGVLTAGGTEAQPKAPVLQAAPMRSSAPAAPSKTAPPRTPRPTGPGGGLDRTDAKAADLVERVQRFYEGVSDFSASFEQRFTSAAFGRTQKSSGTVTFKKPGKMRWDYEKPRPKQFILSGTALTIWDPEERQVVVNDRFAADRLSTSVTFLWGKGRLADEFTIARSDRTDLGEGPVLRLVPKRPDPQLRELFLAINPRDHSVQTSVVVDSEGNENRFDFSALKLNTGVTDAMFEFTPPPGASTLDIGARGDGAR